MLRQGIIPLPGALGADALRHLQQRGPVERRRRGPARNNQTLLGMSSANFYQPQDHILREIKPFREQIVKDLGIRFCYPCTADGDDLGTYARCMVMC